MKKTIAIALAASAAGILAGFVTTGTSALADDEGPKPDTSITRECHKVTDTQCVIWKYGRPDVEGPAVVRFIDEGQFCRLVRLPGPAQGLRCEGYWPFQNPVINSDLK